MRVNITAEELTTAVRNDPFLKSFNLRVLKAEDGEVIIECDLQEHLKRVGDIMNGGAVMSLVDTAGGLCIITSENLLNQVTSSLTVNFLRPISKGPVTAKGKLVKAGKNLAYVEVEVTDGEGKLSARAIGTWFVFR